MCRIFSQNPYFLKIHSNNCGFFKKVMNAPACWSWGVRWKKYRTLIKHVLFQVCLDTLMLRAPCPDYSSSFVRARKTHWCFQMRTPLPYSTPQCPSLFLLKSPYVEIFSDKFLLISPKPFYKVPRSPLMIFMKFFNVLLQSDFDVQTEQFVWFAIMNRGGLDS